MKSHDFDLDKSCWFNMMRIGLHCRNAKVGAEVIITSARNLGKFDYEPTIGTELASAETALSEALLAVKLARSEYEKCASTNLIAAE